MSPGRRLSDVANVVKEDLVEAEEVDIDRQPRAIWSNEAYTIIQTLDIVDHSIAYADMDVWRAPLAGYGPWDPQKRAKKYARSNIDICTEKTSLGFQVSRVEYFFMITRHFSCWIKAPRNPLRAPNYALDQT